MKIPRVVGKLIDSFEKLPGIGPKTASRLTYYLLQSPPVFSSQFAEDLLSLHRGTRLCSICANVDEIDPCAICTDPNRDHALICVVEKALDIVALERSGRYSGLYHVLGGALSPLNNIGPEELHVKELEGRLTSNVQPVSLPGGRSTVKEIILATNAGLEGEATALYLSKLLHEKYSRLRVTRIGRGLPVGSDIEYADEITLLRAMEGRQEY